jgi:DNA modification methylase
MKIEQIKASKLKPATYNPRQISTKQYKDLSKSIATFGLVDPIIVNKDYTVIGGHQRLKVLNEMQTDTIPCVVLDLSKEKERELNVRLNKNTGDFDIDILANEFDIDELVDWGFKHIDLDINIDKITEGNTEDDHIPEVKESRVKLGDVWQLGNHRLMCGDSTKESDVEKLMNGQKADMVFTDPPYGCDLKSTRLGEEVINDELQGDDLINFFDAVFKNIPLKDWGVLYWFYSTNRVAETRAIAEKYYKLKDTIIWVKDSFVPGRNDYHNKFEPILYLEKIGKGEVKRIWNGQRDKSNVWNFNRDRNVKHPTNKPVQLIKFALLNSSNKNNIIIDPFLGSGSTLIACEKTNRVCYGMELDTKYCDVIIERWEQFTGEKATKL